MIAPAHPSDPASAGSGEEQRAIRVRILRQDAPGQESYWERHVVPYEPNMNVISVLQRIAAGARAADGRPVAPVAWDCNCLEEVCGSCTMLINGATRMACSALVDRLLEDGDEIELRPMSKFPVVRDLVVDRRRLFRGLEKVKAWVPVDDSYDHGAGPRISPEEQEEAYPLSECMSCGCCVEACPQYTKVEVVRLDDVLDHLSHIRLLKVDVEGNEPNVLAGAVGLIESGRVDFVDLEVVRSHLGPRFEALQQNLEGWERHGVTFWRIDGHGHRRRHRRPIVDVVASADHFHLVADTRVFGERARAGAPTVS